jgi:protein-S-isoprenylcysteine O-methyltransferase Ste14
MTCFIWFWGWLALGVRDLDEQFAMLLPLWTRWLGGIVMGVGLLIVLVCASVFVVRGRGTPAPFDAPREFVAIGPYRYVRNPMYLGGLTMLAGFGLVHQSAAMCLFTLPAALVAHLFVVLVEEKQLERRFGAPYHDYKRLVNRWMPDSPHGTS